MFRPLEHRTSRAASAMQLSCPANVESNPVHEIGTHVIEFKSRKNTTLITLQSLKIKFLFIKLQILISPVAHNSAYGYQ